MPHSSELILDDQKSRKKSLADLNQREFRRSRNIAKPDISEMEPGPKQELNLISVISCAKTPISSYYVK
jgi:hypothetical protein